MTPVEIAALISGGWATAVAAIGYVYNRAALRSVNRNAMYALDAAHVAQFWEKKAAVYVEALAALVGRRDIREAETTGMFYRFGNEQAVMKELDQIMNPDWRELEARLTAYADRPCSTP
jgi:hypothetical protein